MKRIKKLTIFWPLQSTKCLTKTWRKCTTLKTLIFSLCFVGRGESGASCQQGCMVWAALLQAGSCGSWAPQGPFWGRVWLWVLMAGFPPCGRFVAEQQSLAPPAAPVQPATCSPARPPAPPPIFSPSLIVPHSSFTSHQPSTPLHLHQWPQQQVQQHRLYLQVLEQQQLSEGWLKDGLGFLEGMGFTCLIKPGQGLCTSSIPIVSPHRQVLSLSRLTLHLLRAIFSNKFCYHIVHRRNTQFFKHSFSSRESTCWTSDTTKERGCWNE